MVTATLAVLVTGGAGYVGSTVVRELLERGEEVISIDNLYRGDYIHLSAYKSDPHLKMKVGDISSNGELRASLKDVRDLEAVVHLAAVPGLERCSRDPKRATLTNILGTHNVLEVARECDAQKVVFASSAAVFGVPQVTPITEEHPLDPINLYGITKLAGEKIVESYNRNYGLDTVVLRFGNIYGVGLFTYWETVIPRFIKQAMEGKPLTVFGSGDQGRDFVHVFDVSNAVLLALNHGTVSGEAFNLGGGLSVSVNTIANIVTEIFRDKYGRKVNIVHLPPREGEPYVEDFCFSVTKIKDKMEFRPQWSVRRGIEQTIEYCVRNV